MAQNKNHFALSELYEINTLVSYCNGWPDRAVESQVAYLRKSLEQLKIILAGDNLEGHWTKYRELHQSIHDEVEEVLKLYPLQEPVPKAE